MPRTISSLLLIVLTCVVNAAQPKPKDAKDRYECRDDHDPNGIGKFDMGREIAHVMGFQAAGWLERPERENQIPAKYEVSSYSFIDRIGPRRVEAISRLARSQGKHNEKCQQ